MIREEKRRARRFELSLPVAVMEAGHKKPSRVAHTRDISSSGLLLDLDEDVRPGTRLDLVLTLPGEITQTVPVRLRCLGHVVRRERRQERMAVAVTIERYEFLRAEDEPARVSLFQ